MNWRPTTSLARLRERARVLQRMRAYFDASGALEVSTPLLVPHASSEPSLHNLALRDGSHTRYLRTSPESSLKRLLCAGSGDVYELGAVFRGDEAGRLHLCEFTLLEWYRVGFDHHALMDDVAQLLQACGLAQVPQKITWSGLFKDCIGAAPRDLENDELAARARALGVAVSAADCNDRALLLDALFVSALAPRLNTLGAVFVHDFPPELRAYARLGADGLASRFELIVDGIELANGYHEIIDVNEQAACFESENALRRARGLPTVSPDRHWLDALACGMPPAAGVALGVERLLMILGHGAHIEDFAAFASATPARANSAGRSP